MTASPHLWITDGECRHCGVNANELAAAVKGLYFIKFVSDRDGSWTAVRDHTLKSLSDARKLLQQLDRDLATQLEASLCPACESQRPPGETWCSNCGRDVGAKP